MSEKTILPTIHLNGTGAKTLMDEYTAVANAVMAAEEALDKATCNARDFYPQGDGAQQRAAEQRARMFALLKEVREYAFDWAGEAVGHVK